MRFETSISIARPPSAIYARMLDDIREESRAFGRPVQDLRVGTLVTMRALSRHKPGRYTITHLEPERIIGFQFDKGRVEYSAKWILEPEDGGTHVILLGEVRVLGAAVIFLLTQRLMRRKFIAGSDSSLAILKRHMEEVLQGTSSADAKEVGGEG